MDIDPLWSHDDLVAAPDTAITWAATTARMPAGAQGRRSMSGSHSYADASAGPRLRQKAWEGDCDGHCAGQCVSAPAEVPDFLLGPGEIVNIGFGGAPGRGPRRKGYCS